MRHINVYTIIGTNERYNTDYNSYRNEIGCIGIIVRDANAETLNGLSTYVNAEGRALIS